MADNKREAHRDLGQRQAEDLNSADWNQREGSQADPGDVDSEQERQEKAAAKDAG